MKLITTKLKDCVVIEPEIFGDERGFFLETYQKQRYKDIASINLEFVQDNHSRSSKHVLRGLHFQTKKPQGKLVRVVSGEVYDVVVDIRKDSKTYGKWVSVLLSAKNKKQIWVPPGFAHGFMVTSETADLEYKCTDYYDPSNEGCIIWNDPDLLIDWPSINPIISEKDRNGDFFSKLSL